MKWLSRISINVEYTLLSSVSMGGKRTEKFGGNNVFMVILDLILGSFVSGKVCVNINSGVPNADFLYKQI